MYTVKSTTPSSIVYACFSRGDNGKTTGRARLLSQFNERENCFTLQSLYYYSTTTWTIVFPPFVTIARPLRRMRSIRGEILP